jgi:hypothetical protein
MDARRPQKRVRERFQLSDFSFQWCNRLLDFTAHMRVNFRRYAFDDSTNQRGIAR